MKNKLRISFIILSVLTLFSICFMIVVAKTKSNEETDNISYHIAEIVKYNEIENEDYVYTVEKAEGQYNEKKRENQYLITIYYQKNSEIVKEVWLCSGNDQERIEK